MKAFLSNSIYEFSPSRHEYKSLNLSPLPEYGNALIPMKNSIILVTNELIKEIVPEHDLMIDSVSI